MKNIFNKLLLIGLITFGLITPAFALDPNYINGPLTVVGKFKPLGAQTGKVTNTAVTYTALVTDYEIHVTSTASARTINLPTAAGITNQLFIIKDTSGGAASNNITVDPFSSETIDGSSTKVISANYGWIVIRSDGANWNVIGSNIASAGSGDVTAAGSNAFSSTNTHSGAETFTGTTKIKGLIITATLTAINTTGAITASQLAAGGISSTTAAGVTATLPTATLLYAALGSPGVGASFIFVAQNTAGSNTLTIAVNTGITVGAGIPTGSDTLTIANSATQGIGVFRLVFSSTTTAILTRIG